MVAIREYILIVVATCFVSMSVVAQQIQPRIIGLETNDEYMQLLGEDNNLSIKEDSLTVVVESLRELFRSNAEDAIESRDKIISLENQLFELRARKAVIVDSLNVIEQEWVLNNMETVTISDQDEGHYVSLIRGSSNVSFIHESENVKLNLSKIDYENLVKAESLEPTAEAYRSQYIVNYENMLSLKSSYDLATTQSEGSSIINKFKALKDANADLVMKLDNVWGFIYDNKSFAYSLLMEMMGFGDILEREGELMRSAQAEITSKEGIGGSDEILRYLIQKSSMIQYEILVGEKLELMSICDSLSNVGTRLKGIEKISPPEVEIEERLFIDYEPAVFNAKSIYNDSSNPIPRIKIYDNGVIFRIRLGGFKTKQSHTLFRNTSPIYYEYDDKKQYCYYAGGYATYQEALDAQVALKKHGFRSPQVVIWSDGRSHNLTTHPLPYVVSYKIEIETETLPAEINQRVTSAGSNISKIGNNKFVIAPLERQSQVDSLVSEIKSVEPALDLKVEKSESGLEF